RRRPPRPTTGWARPPRGGPPGPAGRPPGRPQPGESPPALRCAPYSWLLALDCREGEPEVGPLPRLGLHTDLTPVALHNLLADRQANARARILLRPVQPLERHEQPVHVLRVN